MALTSSAASTAQPQRPRPWMRGSCIPLTLAPVSSCWTPTRAARAPCATSRAERPADGRAHAAGPGTGSTCRARTRGRPRSPGASCASPSRVGSRGSRAPRSRTRGCTPPATSRRSGRCLPCPVTASADRAHERRADDGLPDRHQQVQDLADARTAAETASARSRRSDRTPAGCPATSGCAGA